MLALLLLATADDAATTVARTRSALSVERRCVASDTTTDITVCGLRNADRFRTPFRVHDAGDPRHEGVLAERARLTRGKSELEKMSPFLVGGGMAGVSATFRADGGTQVRKPAS